MEFQNFEFFNFKIVIDNIFKFTAIVLSIFYLLYAIVIEKQNYIMNRTLKVKNNYIFFIISSLQIIMGIILVILAIFLL